MRTRFAAVLTVVCAAALAAQGQPDRANLEQLVRQRMAQVTKQRLGATDEQMVKLEASNTKFDEQRRILLAQEREIRVALRKEMLRSDSARQGHVADLMDRLIKTQHDRVDIQEHEQQELAGFLTPLQRAKYFALEQQIRQRVTQLRQMQQLQQPGRVGRLGRAGLPPAGRGVQPPQSPQ